MRRKIYIAGKITGDTNYRSKFAKISKRYRSSGFAVINPALLPAGMINEDYAEICFGMLNAADMVVFLPDFTDSCGAKLEMAYCQYIMKPMEFLEETTVDSDILPCPTCGRFPKLGYACGEHFIYSQDKSIGECVCSSFISRGSTEEQEIERWNKSVKDYVEKNDRR